ncbi:MAG: flagellar biosynthesis anti-sigma factor FlgM [Sulfurimonas sp.]|nr:flagellar biosynthesis anti-sigma factor FlgM [Sulfurimonas sp.]
MISQANSSALRSVYASGLGEAKETKKEAGTTVNKQGDTSKIEQIKEAINSGEYKVDLQTLSEKIAQELL